MKDTVLRWEILGSSLIFLTVSNARGVSANISASAPVSSAPVTCLNQYGQQCDAIGGVLGWAFWPVTYNYIAATKYLIVSNNITSTSISHNSGIFTIPQTDIDKYYNADAGYPATVDNLTVSTYGTLLTWPTDYALVDTYFTVTSNYATTDSRGQVNCTSTVYDTTLARVFVTPVPSDVVGIGAIALSPEQLAEMGFDPLLNCSGGGNGIPTAQVAVLSLTATSMIISAGSPSATGPATPAKPAPSITIISETSKPKATPTTRPVSEQYSQLVDSSVPYATSSASISGYYPVPATDTIPLISSAAELSFGSSVSHPGLSNPTESTSDPLATHSPALEVTENPQSEYLVGSQTLSPGGSIVVVAGKTVSLASYGTELVVEGSTTVVLNPEPGVTPVTVRLTGVTEAPIAPAITFGKETITRDPSSDYIIDGQTLAPGGPALTISGTTVSLVKLGTALVLGSSTIAISPMPSSSAVPVISIDGSVITADSDSAFIVGTQTLIPGGPAVTVPGEILSFASSDAELIIISSPTPTSTLGLAQIIMSALGGGVHSSAADISQTASAAAGPTTQSVMPFVSGGTQTKGNIWWICMIFGLYMGIQIFLQAS